MYLSATVTRWQSPKGSQRRIAPMDGGTRNFLLNPARMSEITEISTGSRFKYTDRYPNRRDAPCYVEISQTPEEIITAFDVVSSATLTLTIFHNNNPNSSTQSITIPAKDLIYADRYNADPTGKSWVVLEEGAFKIRDGLALVDMSLEEILTGTSQLLDYDGNGYTTTIIGDQEWIVENLRVTHYSDGTAVPNITADLLWQADTDGAYCYYDNDESNFDFIGLLYNWYAATNVHDIAYFERGGVQEVGWHVPTYAEWTTLLNSAGGILLAGGPLKEVGTTHWLAPNVGATDAYGFKWISGGNRYIDMWWGDGFANQGAYGDCWSTTEDPLDADDGYGFYTMNDNITAAITDSWKFTGQNIRCVRDV